MLKSQRWVFLNFFPLLLQQNIDSYKEILPVLLQFFFFFIKPANLCPERKGGGAGGGGHTEKKSGKKACMLVQYQHYFKTFVEGGKSSLSGH